MTFATDTECKIDEFVAGLASPSLRDIPQSELKKYGKDLCEEWKLQLPKLKYLADKESFFMIVV